MYKGLQTLLLVVTTLTAFGHSAAACAGTTGDSELISLVEAEYASLPDFDDRLARLELVLADRNDPRAIFAAMYVVLTRNARSRIEDGYFADGQWVAAFMVAFGNYYRQAFFDYETGNLERVPGPWRVSFDASKSGGVTVFQHAILGIHAHINRDMAYAIADVTPYRERSRRLPDFVRTNRFIVESIDEVEDAVASYNPDLGALDAQLNRQDEKLLKQTLSRWRFRAWREAAYVYAGGNAVAAGLLDAYRNHATARQAVYLRDSYALFVVGNAGQAARLRLAPKFSEGLPRGHPHEVLVEMRHGGVLEVDLD